MNSGSYVDPKFLTGEDYSQGGVGVGVGAPGGGYMSQTGAGGGAGAGAIDYYHSGHHSVQYPGSYPVNSQSGSLSCYGRDAASAAAAMGYGSYYQQCGMSPHMQMAAAHHLSSPLGGNGNNSTPQQPPAISSPVSSQQMNRSPNPSPVPSVVSNANNQMLGYGPTTPQPQDTPGGGGSGGMNDGGMSSDCSDDEASPGGGSGGQMPVVYPWMKKIHVAGSGKKMLSMANQGLQYLFKKTFRKKLGSNEF